MSKIIEYKIKLNDLPMSSNQGMGKAEFIVLDTKLEDLDSLSERRNFQ